ncbi:hypothetical protein DPMN_090267 [Dreissena polymorpha]|uniref:G-protein coupled receptors family 1 profile domain-containing protein n=1 Tax=Dreissena polymorpha TaxID=45954 RepID=A0A9D4KZV3_DREPO|nr:hypothetical protein DPMN_090267 [Dreissena polymorpha]
MYRRRGDSCHTSTGFCSVVGGIRHTLSGSIVLTLAAIALYRLLNVMYFDSYMLMSRTRQFTVTLSLCWLVPMGFSIPPALHLWGAFTLQSSIVTCTYDLSGDQSNKTAGVTAAFIVPCLFCVYCYTRIGVTSFRRLRQDVTEDGKSKALKLSSMMMSIFLLFFLGTFPYTVVNWIDVDYKYPINHIWSMMFGWGMFCFNPLLITILDSRIRNVYKNIFMGEEKIVQPREKGFAISRTVIDNTDF